ncbi:MAG: hypothetical protein LBG27_11490, partial [Spirochaetaceae bacterium]|nr:hypothetical protein [Spirochaetaceae bacterium]
GADGIPFETLEEAYVAALADAGRKKIIVFSNPIGTDPVMLDPTGKTVAGDGLITIVGNKTGVTLQRSVGDNGTVLKISGGAKIAFENVMINGNMVLGNTEKNANKGTLAVTGTDTEVALGDGVVITGEKHVSPGVADCSGILVSEGAKVVMNAGSTVTGCFGLSSPLGTILVHGSGSRLVISDGVRVSGNSGGFGGGVGVRADGEVTMHGRVISGNTAFSGGGAYVDSGTFTMNGGIVYGDESAVAASPRNIANDSGTAVFIRSGDSNVDTSEVTLDKRS